MANRALVPPTSATNSLDPETGTASGIGEMGPWSLNQDSAAIRFLKANLKEEKAADKKLNTLAEAKLNRKATGARVAAARVSVKKRTETAPPKKPAKAAAKRR